MSYGTITIGRLVLRETFQLTEADDPSNAGRTMALAGEESSPPLTSAALTARHDDILALPKVNVPFPVVFTDKPDRNGYYVIADSTSDLSNIISTTQQSTWKIDLARIGSESETDLESRLTGTVRANDFSLAGEAWHAPAIGHYSYYTGANLPTPATRTSVDGTLTLYRGLSNGLSPRWGCAPTSYPAGRVRVLDAGVERAGVNTPVSAGAWELNNALVRVKPVGQTISSNPSFDVDTSGWTAQSGTIIRSTAQVYPSGGIASLLVTPDGVSATGGALNAMSGVGSVTAGASYIASCWFYSPTGWSDLRACVDWYDSSGVFLSTTFGNAFAIPANAWTNTANTLTAPASASRAVLRIRHGGTPASSNFYYAWSAKLTPAITLEVAAWDGSAWETKNWNVSVVASGAPVTAWSGATILRNDFEQCILRLIAPLSPGRVTLDLTLRRGSRFIEGYLQRGDVQTLAVYLNVLENATNVATGGYVVATSNDANGNKATAGTAKTFTPHGNLGVQKSSATFLDFYLGAVVGGTGATAVDAVTVLRDQYIGALAEFTVGVRR